MKPQHAIALVLIIALVTGAAAAGGTPPTLPHQFFGNVTIGGSPAPAGTVITAMIAGTECGSFMVTDAGRYGDPDWRLGKPPARDRDRGTERRDDRVSRRRSDSKRNRHV
ncbi:MAG: hypothetical protein ACOX0O_07555 [Candidatus Methanoculleus thermohydrogenotrophicum]